MLCGDQRKIGNEEGDLPVWLAFGESSQWGTASWRTLWLCCSFVRFQLFFPGDLCNSMWVLQPRLKPFEAVPALGRIPVHEIYPRLEMCSFFQRLRKAALKKDQDQTPKSSLRLWDSGSCSLPSGLRKIEDKAFWLAPGCSFYPLVNIAASNPPRDRKQLTFNQKGKASKYSIQFGTGYFNCRSMRESLKPSDNQLSVFQPYVLVK